MPVFWVSKILFFVLLYCHAAPTKNSDAYMSVSKVLDRNQDFWPLKEGTKCQNREKFIVFYLIGHLGLI